ncbi:hypothetical protein D3C80_1073710 [compost metagenome]
MRGIDQAVRYQETHVLQAGVDLGRGPGEQQHHPGQEHQDRQDRRGQPGSGLECLLREQQAPGLVGQQQHAGQQQRQHHVDQPIQQQGRCQRRGAELVGKSRQQDRFEYPDAARYVAEHTCGQGQQVHQHKGTERRCFGQQQIQHGGGSGNIQCGDQQLQGGQACARQAKRAAAQLYQQAVGQWLLSQAPAVQAEHQHAAYQQHGYCDTRQQARRQTQCGRGRRQVAQGRQGGQGRQRAAQ